MQPQQSLQEYQNRLTHCRRALMTPDGRAMLELLEELYCERRTLLKEYLPLAGQQAPSIVMRPARVTSYSDNALEMARNEGRREVVLFLKDLVEMEGA